MICRRRPFVIPVLLFFSLFVQSSSYLTSLPTLISLSHSLLLRVATARYSRNDLSGAARARSIAEKLNILGFRGGIWSLAWDYASNYLWRGVGIGGVPMEEIGIAVREIAVMVGEFVSLRSDRERAAWGVRNYSRVTALCKKVVSGLKLGFSQSGPVREFLLIIQKEIVEGDLVKDCLEIGSKDLEGLARIAVDLFFPPSPSPSHFGTDRDL